MAIKVRDSIQSINIEERNEQLLKNGGKYRLYTKDLPHTIGIGYNINDKQNKRPFYENYRGLIDYTYNNQERFSKELNEQYGRDIDKLGMYVNSNVKPSFMVNDYEKLGDYRKYVGEVYGHEESYAGHLAGLVGIRDNAENLVYDILPDMEGKTFADYINEILQYSDVKYAMEKDRVGIVKDIRVADAIKGVITTNINNYSGKDTRLGMFGNQLYARTLLNGANFNSMRRTKYITDGLETIYGNNLSNVYNLSSLFRINEETGRIPEIDSQEYTKEYITKPIQNFLQEKIVDFQTITGEWNKGYSMNSTYFGFKSIDNEWIQTTPVDGSDGFEYFAEEGNSLDSSNLSTFKSISVKSIEGEKITVNKGSNILNVTNKLFSNRKIKTMLGRYYVGEENDKKISVAQSAISERFGLSHGRNLLTKDAWENGTTVRKGGYDNPYCRVWTYHNQYSKMTDLIRPFGGDGEFLGVSELQKNWNAFRNYEGPYRLEKHGVVGKNGMVNITPSRDSEVDIKNCMFSIENLAWKGINIGSNSAKYKLEDGSMIADYQSVLSKEQQGPNGGRIMWFPPYDIEFQENVNVKWDSSDFIGRGESVYTYVNTKRSGTLSFTMLVDNPAILNYWMINKKNNATEDDEQKALRFFAGCETMDPDAAVTEAILNGEYEGGSLNVSGAVPEKDIIFYTFFPNNYSGVDNKTKFQDVLFMGQGRDKSVVEVESKETAMLGYEMTTNPISAFFTKKDVSGAIDWKLDDVFDYDTAHEMGLDLFSEAAQISFNDFKSGNYDLFESYFTGKLKKEDAQTKQEDNEMEIVESVLEIEKYAGKYNDIDGTKNYDVNANVQLDYTDKKTGEKKSETYGTYVSETLMHGVVEELKKLWSELEVLERNGNKKTSMYSDKVSKITENTEKLNGYKSTVSSLESKIISCQEKNEDNNNIYIEEDEKNSEVEAFLTGSTQYNKTNVIYFVTKNGEISKADDAKHAYIQYMCDIENVKKKYDTEELAKSNFIGEKEDINLCAVKNKFYTIETTSIRELKEEHFTLTTKKDFKKSDNVLGKIQSGKKTIFVVKTKSGETLEFDNASDASSVIISNVLLPVYESIPEFEESKDGVCLIGNNFRVKRVVETNTPSDIINAAIIDMTEDDILEKYYQNHIYMTSVGAKEKNTYGRVQYFYTMATETTSSYKNLQDFVIKSGLSLDFNDGKTYNHTVGLTSDEDKFYNLKADLLYTDGGLCGPDIYQYPCDNSKVNTCLTKDQNYTDLQSFGLNSTYEIVKKHTGDNTITCSFGEFYAGKNDNDEKYRKFVLDCEYAVLKMSGCTDEELETYIKEAEERINYISLIFGSKQQDNENKVKVNGAKVLGDASSDGQKDKNIELAKLRAESMKSYLDSIKLLKDKVEFDESNQNNEEEREYNNVDDNLNISDVKSKIGRRVRTQIIVGEDDLLRDDIDKKKQNGEKLTNEELMADMRRYRRYDNEYLFFEMLKENDSIAYNKLVDKVKYFSPAFHSTTPEGFNSRLTFLHQCTRQGPTVTASDIAKKTTASNLAFGRAPFCILRLGDFLNTKIVINSVNISYPDNQWDINPEGIGMQYMMAKVQMNIDIIGGSDLSAPIKRLQNAVSFNYYANTSLYDNRSDIAQYNSKGEIDMVRQWNPEVIVPKTDRQDNVKTS